jgi:hypothetical protein
MAAPKHVRIIDEFPYFYTRSVAKENYTESYYSTVVAKTIIPYKPLETLNHRLKSNNSFKINEVLSHELRQRRSEMFMKRQAIKIRVEEIKEKMDIDENLGTEQWLLLKKENKGKIGFDPVIISKYKKTNIKAGFNYDRHGIKKDLQVGSEYDFLNLNK